MRRIIVIAIFLLGASALYFLISGQRDLPDSLTLTSDDHQARTLAPDFTLSTMQGETVSLSDYRGKVVLLNFWASWCPPCRAEMPSMEELSRKMKGRNFVLLAVNVEKNSRPAVEAFLKKIPLSFPILLDQAQQAAGLYRVGGIPQTFIINQSGEIVQTVSGARDWNSPEIMKSLLSLTKGEGS